MKVYTDPLQRQRWGHANIRMQRDHIFYAAILVPMEVEECYDIPTASTNGKRVRYNPDYVATLSNDGVLWLLAHEALHVVFGHPHRFAFMTTPETMLLLNLGADAAINWLLRDFPGSQEHLDAPMPDVGTFEGAPTSKTAEFYVKWLQENQQKPQDTEPDEEPDSGDGESGGDTEGGSEETCSPEGEPDQDGDGGDGGDGEQDSEDAQGGGASGEGSPEGEQDGESTGSGAGAAEGDPEGAGGEGAEAAAVGSGGDGDAEGGNGGAEGGKPAEGEEDSAPWGAEDIPEFVGQSGNFEPAPVPEGSSKSQEEQRWKTQVVQAAATAASAGTLPGWAEEYVQGMLEVTEINFRALLAREMTQVITGGRDWTRPSRRSAWSNDVVQPANKKRTLGHVALCCDTSASMANADTGFALRAAQDCLTQIGNFELTVIHNDTDVREMEHFQPWELPIDTSKWSWKGRGGTSLAPALREAAKLQPRPSVILYVTDGETGGNFGQACGIPVVWLLTRDVPERYMPKHGKAIRVKP